ncbi:SDR family NAD(P)-dependent oxidoreductase [Hirschia baltica]|uniref:Short-chain dehydrogenase/reductase SDR n=1 Tax=Hirschia baltica (strain ATCC 49814 / DSM 5838 / IFAM 1418) TaxID=582402 RepID=C6XQX8_HIRBI|nr:SDR family NAD(P)-dependent oxidoreductase [Hirschia baltica]ACT60509.1 short-chain dehydrogenase/reductase SDR [Hirschia baltica ATCC 49814]
MSNLDFTGKVAIITGAGNGLGKSHALELARRGAKVVVNDLGGARDGTGGSLSAAEEVVKAIEAAGGEAIANGANVTKMDEVEAMVASAMDKWGRVDILINNAGILRDKSFSKMTMDDYRLVIDVHLMGSANCSKAVWEIMKEQKYGRIMMTSSPSGLYGIFGQANYSAAKAGVVGLMNALTLEGRKYDIRVNALAPTAATRMTMDIGIPEALLEQMQPESITAGVVYLVSEDAPSKCILSAAGGGFARAYMVETQGIYLKPDEQTAENVAAQFDAISAKDNIQYYEDTNGPIANFMGQAQAAQKS